MIGANRATVYVSDVTIGGNTRTRPGIHFWGGGKWYERMVTGTRSLQRAGHTQEIYIWGEPEVSRNFIGRTSTRHPPSFTRIFKNNWDVLFRVARQLEVEV